MTQTTNFYGDITGISAVDMTNAWVSDGSIAIRNTTDGGTTWKTQTPGPSPTYPYNLLRDVFFKDVNNGWTVGDNGTIYHTTDGGSSWTKQTSGTGKNLRTVFFLTASVGWAAGDNTSMLQTTNGGASWAVFSAPTVLGTSNYGINDICFTDASRGLAASDDMVLVTTNGGATWKPDIGGIVYSVSFATPDIGWAVGAVGAIFKSTNGTWTTYTDVGDATLYSVCFPDADHGWACGDGGALYKYTQPKSTSVSHSDAEILSTFALDQNYPNPFNPSTNISFSLPSRSFVSLKIFDLMGRDVATLVSAELSAGTHSRQWNADGVQSGVYYYRLQAGEYSTTKTMIVLK